MAMALRKVYEASTVFQRLNGLINVFKPAGKSVQNVRTAILHNICLDLNEMNVRSPRKQTLLLEPGGAQNPVIRKITDLSDDILAVGPRYQMQDIRCRSVAHLGTHTSGVLLLGINKGSKLSTRIHQNRPLRVYHVTGRLGTATETHFYDSRITVKSKYNHINMGKLIGISSSLQASHQRKMFELCGVDLQSEAAYQIASKGIIRPADNSHPVIYGIKLIEFNRPDFTLEIHAINENETYLATLISEIAIELKTVAHCTAIRCIRHGHFTVDESLLRRHWNLNGVFANFESTKRVLKEHPNLLRQTNVQLSSE